MTTRELEGVYAEAARIAWWNGKLTRDERDMLDGMRARLGLDLPDRASPGNGSRAHSGRSTPIRGRGGVAFVLRSSAS
jgi:hypothetical protein